MTPYFLPAFSVLFGGVLAWLIGYKVRENVGLLLGFSGSFLLSITVLHLLPELFAGDMRKKIGVFVLAGILLQVFLEFFSKGAEHGHVHFHSKAKAVSLTLFMSLSLHAVLEGFPLREHPELVYGIVVHKIPIAIILTSFFLRLYEAKLKAFLFILLFSLMTPLGALIAGEWRLIDHYAEEITALVAGVLLHVSTIILFESNDGHRFNVAKLSVVIFGMVLAYFI